MNILHNLARGAERALFLPLRLLCRNYDAWPVNAPRRLFAQNLYIGLLMELIILIGGHAWWPGALMPKEDRFLDLMLLVGADSASSGSGRPAQLFLDVDEQTWRSAAWGGGEPRTPPLEGIARLARQAAAHGARYVIVDFVVGAPGKDADQADFVAEMEKTLERYPDSRFLFARAFRKPLAEEPLTVQTLRASFAVDTLMARHPGRVHAVAPRFLGDRRGVERHWRLWESACVPLPDERGDAGEGRWAAVPSPQLMIAALERGSAIPWTPAFGERADGLFPADTLSCAASMPGAEASEEADRMQREGHSARMADYQAGKWVERHLGTCYRQDTFTGAFCGQAGPPGEQRRAEEYRQLVQRRGRAAPGRLGDHLAGRVLFRYSDLKREQEEAQPRGRPADSSEKNPHFRRLSAQFALNDAPPEPGPDEENWSWFEQERKKRAGVVIIGGSYEVGGDIHNTPLGKMPGAMVIANAVDTMQTCGILQPLPGPVNFLLTLLALVAFSALFARLSGWRAFWPMILLMALLLGPCCLWLLKRGIWLNLAAPLGVIWLHREIAKSWLFTRNAHKRPDDRQASNASRPRSGRRRGKPPLRPSREKRTGRSRAPLSAP